MDSDKLTITVPCDLKYTACVADFAASMVAFFQPEEGEKVALELKVVLTEAFINIVRHSDQESAEHIRISFDLLPQKLNIRLRDNGRGIALNQCYPPYPEDVVGTSQTLLKTMYGEVQADVRDARTIDLSFKEYNLTEISPEQLSELAPEGGMGISFMTKLMDGVSFSFGTGEGNCLNLTKVF